MSEEDIHCDRCGTTIASDPSLVRIESGPLHDQHPSLNLCPHCADSLTHWLNKRSRTGTTSTGGRRGRRSTERSSSSSRRSSPADVPELKDFEEEDEQFRSMILFSVILGVGIVGTVIAMILLNRR